MSNLEIGKRIRTLRTEKGLSREAIPLEEVIAKLNSTN